MIDAIHFKNFKALRDTTLPLGRFTLIIGPNGSGKTTALQGIQVLSNNVGVEHFQTAGLDTAKERTVSVTAKRIQGQQWWGFGKIWSSSQGVTQTYEPTDSHLTSTRLASKPVIADLRKSLRSAMYSLDPVRLATPVGLQPDLQLGSNGDGLAVVLDRLRDQHPERFEAVNQQLRQWIPEFDRILFETPAGGTRAIMLRQAQGRATIKAHELSQGTLLALAFLTLAYAPNPAPIMAFEDPDHGIHPRLLRDVKDALYRLAYPEKAGENRPAVQVIATTHSPYMVDLFKDHPDEIVIAEKTGNDASFKRLVDIPNYEEIIRESSLGDLWFTGVLGGVPAGS